MAALCGCVVGCQKSRPSKPEPGSAADIARLTKGLRGDPAQCLKAAKALAKLGPRAQAATPQLIAALAPAELGRPAVYALAKIGPSTIPFLRDVLRATTEDAQAKWARAAEALGELGPAAAPAIPDLVRVIQGSDSPAAARVSAVLALGQIGHYSPQVGQVLMSQVRGRADLLLSAAQGNLKAALHRAALWALVRLGTKALGAIRQGLLSRAREQQLAAIHLAAEVGAAHVLPALVGLLKRTRDWQTVKALAQVIGTLGPQAKAAIPALASRLGVSLASRAVAQALAAIGPGAVGALEPALSQPEYIANQNAARALMLMGPKGKPALAVLLKSLARRRADPTMTAQAIGAVAPGDEQALSALVRLLNNPSRELRIAGLVGLGSMGPAAKPAVPALIRALGDTHENVVPLAAKALQAIGPGAASAVPRLVGLTRDKRDTVRRAAAEALLAIRQAPNANRVVLQQLLNDPSWTVRYGTLNALLAHRAQALGAVDLVAAATRDSKILVRKAAINGLGKLQTKSPAAFKALSRFLQRTDVYGDELAIAALGAIGKVSDRAVRRLVSVLKDPKSHLVLRQAALRALGTAGPRAKPAVATIIPLLEAPAAVTRAQAALTLRDIGPAAKAAVAALTETRRFDRDFWVRVAASGALKRIHRAK